MRRILLLLISAILGGVLADSAQAAKASAKKAAAPKAVATNKVAAVKKAAAPVKKTTKRARRASRSRRRGAPRRSVSHVPRQGQPTKERYSEIQQALIEKGYFTGEANGEWNAESMEALKRFQDDQSLKASGKINSLSLIALGLGAKHNPLGVLPVITAPVAGPQAPEATDEADQAAEDGELITPATPGLLQ